MDKMVLITKDDVDALAKYLQCSFPRQTFPKSVFDSLKEDRSVKLATIYSDGGFITQEPIPRDTLGYPSAEWLVNNKMKEPMPPYPLSKLESDIKELSTNYTVHKREYRVDKAPDIIIEYKDQLAIKINPLGDVFVAKGIKNKTPNRRLDMLNYLPFGRKLYMMCTGFAMDRLNFDALIETNKQHYEVYGGTWYLEKRNNHEYAMVYPDKDPKDVETKQAFTREEINEASRLLKDDLSYNEHKI